MPIGIYVRKTNRLAQPIFYHDGTVFFPLNTTKWTGLYTKIDFDDFEKVNTKYWYAAPTRRYARSNHLLLHRFILGLDDPNVVVDHINHNTLDNRRTNLRVTDRRGNSQNKSTSKSGYPGVSWDKERMKWEARIKINNKSKFLGHFKLASDAGAAYRKACVDFCLSVPLP